MTGTVAELTNLLKKDRLAESVVNLYYTWRTQREGWVNENLELRDYLFATDTSTTSNQSLPWKNSTTLPKLTQIRDNLHANYMASLFPNDNWLKWEGYSLDDETQEKKEAIQAYMSNKVREDNFITTVSRCVYDYIDYGNAFGDVVYVNEEREDSVTGETIPGYIGPRLVRVSPLDHIINPTAASYKDTSKITRSIKTLGELKIEAEDFADREFFNAAFEKSSRLRTAASTDGIYTVEDFEKSAGYSMDGFGNLREYYQSPFVEIIEIEGDFHDPETGDLLRNHVITIIDRSFVARKEPIPSWLGKSNKAHVGWRLRPDNLYAMGPLNNLVGMQYRIDHLENLKADVFDLIAYPPLKIIGEVEEFDWAPGTEIHIDEEGSDVQMLVPDTTALNADMQISILEQKMEDFAGAPKQAMGIRTPGEKTAFEVQSLENAAGRIFQEKVTAFEVSFLEPLLNSMLEVSRRNLDGADIVRVLDDDLGVAKFLSVTREDITAKGKLRPVGARHFAARAQMMQNLQGVFTTPVGQMIAPHISSKALANLVEDMLGLDRFDLVQENVAIFEQAETARLANQVQEDLEVEAATPVEEEV
jgi:hypothetical protein